MATIRKAGLDHDDEKVSWSGYSTVSGYEPVPHEQESQAARVRARTWRAGAAALLAAAVVAAAAKAWLGGRSRLLSVQPEAGVEGLVQTSQARCGLINKNVHYSIRTGIDYPLNHIPGPEMCCAMCQGIPECKAFVWKNAHLPGCPFQCWILVSGPTGKMSVNGVVSGMPPPRPQLPRPALQSTSLDETEAALAAATAATTEEPQSTDGQLSDNQAGKHQQLCSEEHENCWTTRCCNDASMRCYMKDAAWAGCLKSCTPGMHASDPQDVRTQWTCLDQTRVPQAVPLATQPALRTSLSGNSLFCWSLVRPEGYEPKLLAFQYSQRASIFACDAYGIYSNRVISEVPVQTSIVNSDMKCEFHEIAWNTRIFIVAWQKVISDGVYRRHHWTVKVDADAVFFAEQLRIVVQSHPTAGYLGNCKYGLHGPIEVLSSKAVDTLAQDYSLSADGLHPLRCLTKYPEAISGRAQWGEDMFLDKCLSKVLGVRSEPDYRLMCESHCDCPDWFWCNNGTERVSYHPFKRVDMYRQCMANAIAGATVAS